MAAGPDEQTELLPGVDRFEENFGGKPGSGARRGIDPLFPSTVSAHAPLVAQRFLYYHLWLGKPEAGTAREDQAAAYPKK